MKDVLTKGLTGIKIDTVNKKLFTSSADGSLKVFKINLATEGENLNK